jgi:predicted metal-dependent peptidase
VIGIDTSGSISPADLRRALSEVVGVCSITRPEAVDVICWDAEVASHQTFEGDEITTLVDAVTIKGGGGTDPVCMARYLDAKGIKPDCIVQFTDGCIGRDWGNWNAPVLWCISRKGITAPVGTSIYVET